MPVARKQTDPQSAWPESHQLSAGRAMAVGAAMLVSLAAVYLIDAGAAARLVAAAMIAGALLLAAVRFVSRNAVYVLCPLMVIEIVFALPWLPLAPDNHWMGRYPLLLLFCLPLVPAVWRSGLLGRGSFKAYAVYFAWALLSVAFSLKPVYSAGRALTAILTFLALVAAALDVNDGDDVLRLLRSWTLILAAVAIVNLASIVFLPGDLVWLQDEGVSRFVGIFDGPNPAGGIAMATIGPALIAISSMTGWRKTLLVIGVLASLACALMADSRAGLIGAALGLGAFALWKYRARPFVIFSGIVVLALIAVTVAPMAPDYFYRGGTTLTGRTEIWSFALHRLAQRPLTGFGYAVEGEILRSRYFPNPQDFFDQGVHLELHCDYLSRAIGLGIPALGLFLFLLLRPFVWLFRQNDDPWHLKSLALLSVLPSLVRWLAESGMGDCRYPEGIILIWIWAMAERQRLLAVDRARSQASRLRASRLRPLGAMAGALALTASLSLAAASQARAATYYVDPAGSDANSGTDPSTPWQTVSKVNNSIFQPGDTVAFKRGGIWREMLEPPSSGTAAQPISFVAYGSGPAPVFYGSDQVSGWSVYSLPVYVAPLASQPGNVYVDSDPGWGLQNAKTQTAMPPGSWYWTGGQLFVRTMDDSNPATHVIEAAVRVAGVLVNGPSMNNNGVPPVSVGFSGGKHPPGSVTSYINYIVIDGLSAVRTAAYGIRVYGSAAPVIRNCIVTQTGTGQIDTGAYENAIHVLIAPQALIQNNVVSYSGNHGNAVNCQRADGSQITGNIVSNWNHNGLDIKESTGVLVEGNVAHDAFIGAGVYGEYNSNLEIDQNYVYNTSNGVQVDDLTTARIEHNFFVNAHTALYLGPNRPVATVLNNCATDCNWAIENDGSARQVDRHNDWACRKICRIGRRTYARLQAYQEAGYGGHDVARKSSCNPPSSLTGQ